ncbi:hypothetical protein FRB97_002339 [Tulasnella sp. 331]|nr:hypothetical protein FRB97_002339 [Tulasnella sp. 331]KAG8890224.1 hypothetical protein FRB98_000552 [Tulasnella sp. 332]
MNDFLQRLALWPKPAGRLSRDIYIGILIGASVTLSSTSIALYYRTRQKGPDYLERDSAPIDIVRNEIVQGVTGLVGNTPLMRVNSLSDALGVEILGKAEWLNPGGSLKDRVALQIIEDAEQQGLLHPHSGSTIFEGTVGSTGISIATIGRARGYETTIIMPDDVAKEKSKALEALGANVEEVRPSSIVDKKQFVNVAKQRALDFGSTEFSNEVDVSISTTATPSEVLHKSTQTSASEKKARGFFADQFESRSNFNAHYKGTGPEIWRQTGGDLDAFVSGAGTGGTIAGTGTYLKTMNRKIQLVLADPQGSGLFNKIKHGVMFNAKESEGTRRRHQVDTVVEGIGINRLTQNFELGMPLIDDAYQVTDAEAVSMSRYLVKHDGLFLGSSSACNLVTSVRLAKKLGQGKTIVTILCDSGSRHYSKFWNDEYLASVGIPVDISIIEKLLVQTGG